MALASYHRPGLKNFEVAPRFLGNLLSSDLMYLQLRVIEKYVNVFVME
jgi:hypothetical protein